jgi:uncharacterized metal-binding protein YceD (DUF177 family)
MDKPTTPWSYPVAVTELPEDGTHYELVADAETRTAVAQMAGLRDLPALTAVFDVASRGDVISVRGEVNARVGQTCVVTLEAIENDVHETVDLLFASDAAPGEEGAKGRKKGDPPEPLENGIVDLGTIATEFLILGLDPYPRKEGVEFASPPEAADPAAHPFAALAALKKRP